MKLVVQVFHFESLISLDKAFCNLKTWLHWIRDSPNGWAPQQEMIVTGLARSGLKEAKEMAEEIARRWVRSNYAVYKTSGTIHEKLDVSKIGEYGGGGEYKPQVNKQTFFF